MIDSPFSCLKFQGLSKNTSATDSGVRLWNEVVGALTANHADDSNSPLCRWHPVIDYRKTKSTVHTVLFE